MTLSDLAMQLVETTLAFVQIMELGFVRQDSRFTLFPVHAKLR